MKITILYHLMPWEIDYCLLTFSQFKKAKYFLAEDVDVTIHSLLNLSSHIIDWDKSQIKKDFFIQKYDVLSKLLIDYNHIKEIYDGDQLYGHLDLQKKGLREDCDYYIGICPDVYFSPKLLSYLAEATRVLNNKYFVVTPQISMFWDKSWDIITNPNFLNDKYRTNWNQIDVFDIINYNENIEKEIYLTKAPTLKWAGWFDLYNKNFYEELCSPLNEWNGYGGWDYYAMLITEYLRNKIDFEQYILNNNVVFEYSVGPLYGKYRDGFSEYYKSQIYLKTEQQIQRNNFEQNIPQYLTTQINQLKLKKII